MTEGGHIAIDHHGNRRAPTLLPPEVGNTVVLRFDQPPGALPLLRIGLRQPGVSVIGPGKLRVRSEHNMPWRLRRRHNRNYPHTYQQHQQHQQLPSFA
ncbi:hypothetical protein D3C84_878480 [compost metagenome]